MVIYLVCFFVCLFVFFIKIPREKIHYGGIIFVTLWVSDCAAATSSCDGHERVCVYILYLLRHWLRLKGASKCRACVSVCVCVCGCGLGVCVYEEAYF